jgi:hypothetical protein
LWMTGSRSADGFAPRRQERLAAGFQGAIAMDIEVQGRAMEPQVLGHLPPERLAAGRSAAQRRLDRPRRKGVGEAAGVPWGDGLADKNVAFLVDVPSLEAYHTVHPREPHPTPAHCTHHTAPLHQQLQA